MNPRTLTSFSLTLWVISVSSVWAKKPAGYTLIKPGQFIMGTPYEDATRGRGEEQHPVTITRAFWLKTTEVTQAEWQAVMGSNPAHFKGCGPDCPVEQVSWFDAVAYLNALSAKEGLEPCYEGKGQTMRFKGLDCKGYRLPTEAEWEYAARAGTTTALYTGTLTIKSKYNGPELDPIAWYFGNSGVTYAGAYDCTDWPEIQNSPSFCGPHPVAQKKPNAWGLYDMLGNVHEWVHDGWGRYPFGDAVTDPTGAVDSAKRAQRGAGWEFVPDAVRTAYRTSAKPETREFSLGFRAARTAR